MTAHQTAIIGLLAVAMCLFIWNRWRYDVVAGFVLLAAVSMGVVPTDKAFDGFSHPAVITVAAVLIISQALRASGIVSFFLRFLALTRGRRITQTAANCSVTALMSAFMNNIGALALMLPITVRDARRAKRPASNLLMPLSFASLLGGLTTLIGTPPNIIISSFREDKVGQPFAMFDFALVGVVVAVGGLLFIIVAAPRLLPNRGKSIDGDSGNVLSIARYVTELRIPETSPLVSTSVGDLEQRCENDVTVLAIVRNNKRRLAPQSTEIILEQDVLIMEGESEALQPLFEDPDLVEVGSDVQQSDSLKSPDVRFIEVVVMPNSIIENESMRDVGMHERFGVNLLAVAREGRAPRALLKHVRFKVGDVLLLQGETGHLLELCSSLGCLAIKNRGIEMIAKRSTFLTPALFALGILIAALGIMPVQLAFMGVVGALVLLKLISLREVYNSIEWPIIVLLGFLIPVGEALHETGATELIAELISGNATGMPVWGLIASIVVISMLLSDVVHNTPTAVLMAPIAYSLSLQLSLPPEPFLMAVAIGAASPYLTPIGHQSNTLVMGPGGYQFGDYWRLGLPLDIVIVCISVPMIMWVWM